MLKFYVAVIQDRHSDPSYRLFIDAEEGAKWIREQLEALKEYISWDYEVTEVDECGRIVAYETFEEGPSGYLEQVGGMEELVAEWGLTGDGA